MTEDPLLHGEVIDDAEVVDDRGASLEELVVAGAPALARAAGGVWWRATKWGVASSARAGLRLARAAAGVGGDRYAGRAVDDVVRELRGYARDLLGITDLEERVGHLAPETPRLPERVALRARGARLLRASAELDGDDPVHPAYARILTELAADEARILRLLASEGARAAIDVRAANLIGVGSQLVAGGFSMIGPEAGCRHRERVPAHLNNLERLGLIWFSQEPIDDPVAYQVLQAQPEVMDAMRRASRARTVQRSIQLTPFGEDFCAICLPTDTAEMEELAAAPEESG
jgi:Abortive infection alpha